VKTTCENYINIHTFLSFIIATIFAIFQVLIGFFDVGNLGLELFVKIIFKLVNGYGPMFSSCYIKNLEKEDYSYNALQNES
jgi:hypothetical protein